MKKACKYCVFYEDGKCEDSKGPDYCCDEFLLDEALFQGGESSANEIKDEIQNEEEDQNEVVEKRNDENSTDMEVTLQSSTLEKKLEKLDEKPKEINVDEKGKKIIITIDLSSLFE